MTLAPQFAVQTPAQENPPAIRVLLAEDEPQVRAVAERVLKRTGFDVVTAGNGADALAILRQHSGAFDVVLSDILMPEMDGIELAVRARAEYPNVKFVFMTGFSDISRDRQRAEGLAYGILGKPFDLDEMVGTLYFAAAPTAV